MTATAPTSNSSPLASAQSLRQRYGRLSPLRLGIFGLVSLGSHLLLLGLFRWAWQVQLATQPLGSPIGIDFVEVDLSDGSFEGQIPDESGTASISGGKLSAAQLNELIASGEATSTEISELEQSEALADSSLATDTTQIASTPDRSSGNGAELEQPRSWFPFGQSQENAGGGLFGDRSSVPTSPSDNTTSPANTDSLGSTISDESDRSNDASESNADASEIGSDLAESTPSDGGNPAPTASSEPAVTDTSTSTIPSTTDSPEAPAGPVSEAPEDESSNQANNGGAASENEINSGGGNSNNTPGRPNDLPPNMSERPVSPDQTVQPDDTLPGPGNAPAPSGDPESEAVAENPTGDASPGSSSSGSSGNSSGSDNGGGEATETDTEANSSGEANGGSNDSDASGDSSSSPNGSETDNAATRLGANLVVDEVQSRALNTQDVFTRLPKPIGDPLSGSQSVSSGRCAGPLAALTPASYGQPVQLRLAVDVSGDVFYVEGIDAAAQTAVGQAIACIAEEWPFEPAQRVIDEGGVEKVENAGAVLFVTVTISLLE